MEERCQAAGEVLLEQPWLPVCISGCQLLAKAWFGDTAYHILLTDMRCVWEETMHASAIQNRAQELNKRLRAPVKAFYSHLREVALPCFSGRGGKEEGEAQVSLTHRGDGGGVSIRLKSELAGLPFHWEFHCAAPPVDTVCSQLVRPLLVMSQLLQTQVDQLGALLARKDAEIQDYKENGATLSRVAHSFHRVVPSTGPCNYSFLGPAPPPLPPPPPPPPPITITTTSTTPRFSGSLGSPGWTETVVASAK
ncbi:unnamed protein product [Merluccius merluccius]